MNQSDNSIRIKLESGKISLSPTLTRHKAVLIHQIPEVISVKLINNKIFQMSNSEFNLPSISIQADKQTVIEADPNRPKRRRSDGGSQQIRRKKLRQTSVPNLRRSYANMLPNFRLKRSTKAARVSIMANKVNSRATTSTPIVSEDKKSFSTGLSDLLDADLLTALTSEDSQLGPLRKCILAKDREGFIRLGNYIASFWEDAAVINDCVKIDNRVAIPLCLKKTVLNRLHRTHPKQEAMIGAAVYIWSRMHREVIKLCQNCRQCSEYGKNIRTSKPFNSSKPLPELAAPNEELQMDFAGPILDSKGKKL